MIKINNLTKSVAVALLVASAGSAVAETVATSANVTVQNAFTLTETAPLSFGTIRAVSDGTAATDIASLVRPADPALASNTPAPVGNAEILQLVPGAPGQFSVTGAAAFTDLDIDLPVDDVVVLTNASAPPTSPDFLLRSFTAHILSGANAGLAYDDGTENLQTDVNGEVNFAVGATLITDITTSTSGYIDAAYSGNFNIVVNY